MDLNENALNYLAALVRVDIRKHKKDVEEFTTRPEQSADEATAVLAKFAAKQQFRYSVYQQLNEARRSHQF